MGAGAMAAMHSSVLLPPTAAVGGVGAPPLPLTEASSAGSGAEGGMEGRELASGTDGGGISGARAEDGCSGAAASAGVGAAGASSRLLLPCPRRIRSSVGSELGGAGASAAWGCRGGTSVVGRLGGGRGTGSESEGVADEGAAVLLLGKGEEAVRLSARAAMTVCTSAGSFFGLWCGWCVVPAAAAVRGEACWISMGGGRSAVVVAVAMAESAETPTGMGRGERFSCACAGADGPSKAIFESAAGSSIWKGVPVDD